MADTRFVIVAMLRTGSTFLIDLLNSHDDIFCDNELFNPHEICRYRFNEGDIEGLEYRNTNPIRFWDEFFYSEFAEQQKVIGFNFMLGQSHQILDKILRNIGFKIIYLSRENKLAQYSSYQKALSTQIWGITNKQDLARQDKSKLKFDFRDFDQWLQEVMTYEYFFKNMLDGLQGIFRITGIVHAAAVGTDLGKGRLVGILPGLGDILDSEVGRNVGVVCPACQE